ncbi:MAG: DNA-binding protein WhiA [Oscillospiraceae bacterium]|nr:DNA-binding protein WhiA [Oscillospiraceae bacterium]
MNDRDKEYGCLYGMLLFCSKFGADEIEFRTESPLVRDMFVRLCGRVTGVETHTEEVKLRSTLYKISLPEERDREEVIFRFRVSSRALVHRIQQENITNNNIFAFLTGAFLSCGSMAEPMKEYHLEFAVPYEELAADLTAMIGNMGIACGTVRRKNVYVVYLKGSESIEDMLTLMGATNSAIELMNVKILKDVRNKANRIANCDTANIERTLTASRRQTEDIEYILAQGALDDLSDELRNMALLRLENPDVSLAELGAMLDKPVGRSGANHRLRRLSEIAAKMREERDAHNG